MFFKQRRAEHKRLLALLENAGQIVGNEQMNRQNKDQALLYLFDRYLKNGWIDHPETYPTPPRWPEQ